MDFADISAILTEINKLATGQESTTPIVDTSTFTSVAQATLLTGTDNYTKAISQVLGRTIFAVRPYDAPMRNLQVTGDDWANHRRKINFCDSDPVTDKAWALTDGQTVDMYEVHKPKVLQTNYYGQTNYSRVYTQADTQMEAAFKGPEELAEFWSSFVLHLSNQIEADRRNLAANLMANHLTGMTVTNPDSVVYLLDEYNAQQGTNLTVQDVYKEANFPGFAAYAYGRINDISRLLKERSIKWHQNWTIDGTKYDLMRHTPYDRQHLYLYSGTQSQIDAKVIPQVYHDNLLRYRDAELITFWQNIDKRDQISATPVVTTAEGVAQKNAAVQLSNVFGCLLDFDAIGYTPRLSRIVPTPMNARGLYTNFWYHYGWSWYDDFTENAVLFLMKAADVGAPEEMKRTSLLKSSTTKEVDPAKS
jgi:hypothetical protein